MKEKRKTFDCARPLLNQNWKFTDLEEVVEPITSTLKVKLKDQATKQDVEKSTELQRSLFRGETIYPFISVK